MLRFGRNGDGEGVGLVIALLVRHGVGVYEVMSNDGKGAGDKEALLG